MIGMRRSSGRRSPSLHCFSSSENIHRQGGGDKYVPQKGAADERQKQAAVY